MVVLPLPLSLSWIRLRGFFLIRPPGLRICGLLRLALSSTLALPVNCRPRSALVASRLLIPMSVMPRPRPASVPLAGLARACKSLAGMYATTLVVGGVKSVGIVPSFLRRSPHLRKPHAPPSPLLPPRFLYRFLSPTSSSLLTSHPSQTTPNPSFLMASSSTPARPPEVPSWASPTPSHSSPDGSPQSHYPSVRRPSVGA